MRITSIKTDIDTQQREIIVFEAIVCGAEYHFIEMMPKNFDKLDLVVKVMRQAFEKAERKEMENSGCHLHTPGE